MLKYSEMCVRLCEEFGPVSNWPTPTPYKPGFLRLAQRKSEKRICKALGVSEITLSMRMRFWEQIYEGQGYTDATGYKIRMWKAMLGLPFLPAKVSFSAIRNDRELLIKYGFMETDDDF